MNQTKIDSIKILKFYASFAKKYPGRLFGLAVSVPMANIFLRMIPPIIVANIINKLTQGEYVHGNVFESFGKDLVLYGVLTVLGGVILWRIAIYLVWTLESYVTRDISRAIFNKYAELDSDFHANSFGGSLVSRATKLTSAYVRIQDTFLFQIYTMFVAYIFVSIVVYPKSSVFVYSMWIATIVFIIVSMLISRRVRHFATIEANAQNKTTGFLADAVTNVLTIKSYAKLGYENKRFSEVTENTRKKTIRLMWATTWRDTYSALFTSSVSIFALVVAVYLVVVRDADLGLVFLLYTYTADITERLWEFNSTALRNYNRAIGDASEGVDTMLTKSKIQDSPQPRALEKTARDISFDHVEFSHSDSENDVLFNDFSLEIEPGTKVGLVGHSGSGKTSLVRLLMRFMDIDSGEIKIGNTNIAHVTQDDLHKQIAYVPQEPLLFHRSLAENIGYSKANVTHEDIEKVAKMAHCHEFITSLHQGYETLVGERGVKLSGGQRQRVAIARAMLKDSPILVLDEATSALDSESEVLIQDALWKLMEGKTALVIAHRLSTVQKMDKIVVLDNGKIVEQGSHAELINKNGTYAKLWAHQSGGFLEE